MIRKIIQNNSFRKFIFKLVRPLLQINTWRIRFLGIATRRKVIKLSSDVESDIILKNKLLSGEPFCLSRFGGTEFKNLMNIGNKKDWFNKLCILSGFFPNNIDLLEQWKTEYWKTANDIDILAVWNYRFNYSKKKTLVARLDNLDTFICLGVLDPFDNEWLSALKGKRVLVVHPFKNSIESQSERLRDIGILPELESLEVVQAVQTVAGAVDPRFDTWFDALNYMKGEISKRDFDVAIIGCGAYGLPLAAHVKSIGKQALHVGGVSQLYFGIKGKRWIEDYGWADKFDENWIFPLDADKPKQANKVEAGCYW